MCGWKDQFGNDSPFHTVSRLVGCWSISLISGLCPCLSLCLRLFSKCLFKLGKALLHCLPPSWRLWNHSFPFVDVNALGLQVSLADICIYYQRVAFLELILCKGDPLGSGHCPVSFSVILYKQPIYGSIHPHSAQALNLRSSELLKE